MTLFKSDLFRSFAVGFGLGAVIVFSSFGGWASDAVNGSVVPQAIAAPAPVGAAAQ